MSKGQNTESNALSQLRKGGTVERRLIEGRYEYRIPGGSWRSAHDLAIMVVPGYVENLSKESK